ncbi:MAG: family 16 glycosylhydrolase [Candidatus Izimaplasma sp.]|nr:family 16 glycosylhydrolase [Candidatus Izimaplasma bacterium]
MKKIIIVTITLVLLVTLSACNGTNNNNYNDRSLVTDDCDHLDNIDEWQPVWCDEFDEDGLPDDTKWDYDVGGSGWGNNELQYYTESDLDNAYVEDGNLHIQALKEAMSGRDYTSARLVTKYRGDWLYGKIQIRAKLPEGRGTWPAIWMLPTEWQYGGWPDSGEIDIMEHVGYDEGNVHGTIHTAAYNHGLGTQIGYSKTVEDATSAFHVYEMEWEPNKITLFIDGEQFAQFGYNPMANIGTENSDAWPFDETFHLILNIAIGGFWGGAQGVDDSLFPTEMVVDYVRVYQKDYAGMDTENPSSVTELGLLEATFQSIQVMWDHAEDDVMIESYDIFVDGTLAGNTTVNSFTIKGLDPDTTYEIGIISNDFAGHKSDMATLNIKTKTVPLVTTQVEAEDYVYQEGTLRETTSDTGGGENVGYIDSGDFLEYLLYVEEEGTYQITYRVASQDGGGEIELYGKGAFPLVTTAIDATGGWQTWSDVTSDTFTLHEGVVQLRLRASSGGFNINYFNIEKVE